MSPETSAHGPGALRGGVLASGNLRRPISDNVGCCGLDRTFAG